MWSFGSCTSRYGESRSSNSLPPQYDSIPINRDLFDRPSGLSSGQSSSCETGLVDCILSKSSVSEGSC